MAVQQNYSAGFSATGSTVDPAEVATFSKLPEEWWGQVARKRDAATSGDGAAWTWGATNIRFLFGFLSGFLRGRGGRADA